MSEVISFKQAVEELIVDVMYDDEALMYVEQAAIGNMTDLQIEDYALPVISSFLGWLNVINTERFKSLMTTILVEYKQVRENELKNDQVQERRRSFRVIK